MGLLKNLIKRSSAKQLEKLEQKVCDLADQLQAIIIEERLQASLDSEEVRETEADLAANLSWKLKNKGLRDVVITLRCGVREFTENKLPNFKIIPSYYKVL